ncbi:flavin-containing monooxygenase [Capillimicrobium parvum]|uniref:Flavin-containing monooxygenase 5 n=1 Tax=Capillimicrobium parvum TaxID=2884022 RepID=A0A9E6Y1Q8_9ACTN|nr:NAD(P)-binding domain-containing protein [Capillimicrobium parvum]UGS37821.1 Ferredoxin--NADP reductase [Capillimicrobium parvum]
MTSSLPRCAIIGAGSSGIAAAKALNAHGLDVTVFEASDRVGGNWVFGNSNGMSSAYRGLHINTSRERMEFRDFPMPKSYPDYPHHTHIAEYFDAYVDHFGFRDRIRFRTTVERAERGVGGGWTLTLDDGAVERFDALLVANGHHWDPRWPEPAFPGSDVFAGTQMHAHFYRDEEVLRDKDVVVLGMGNSAMDIAVESSYVARSTYLAARRGAWIVPKYAFGRPIDQLPNDPRIPFAIRRAIMEKILVAQTGPPERYGLPKPDHRFGAAHPTVSGRILDRIGHGTVVPKPNIARLDGDRVVFTDGTSVHADVVVYCTGYKITFPFFDEDLICAPDNRIELFRRVFHPDLDDVFFVGLLQPLGAIMPLAAAQGEWIADHLRGEYDLPARAEVRADIRRDVDAMGRRYVSSKRHTIQVDFEEYLRDLDRERRAGAERARARGFPLPVPARAVSGAAAG